jgi:hypothetical protein
MSGTQLLSSVPVADTGPAATAIPLESDFDARWSAWMKRGRANERLARRRLGMLAAVIAGATAIAYALMG